MNYDINELIRIFRSMNKDFMTYLSYCDDGIVKIKSYEKYEYDKQLFGNDIGPEDGPFVFPKKLAQNVIELSEGNPRKLENLLALDQGVLGNDPIIIEVDKNYIVRVPSGRERGANKHWRPGGYTKEGIPEAIVDGIKEGNYRIYPAF